MNLERIHLLLAQRRIGYLCTAGPKNRPHITPIFVIFDPKMNRIYFQTNRATKKVRDIKGNPKVSLTVDFRDPINPFKNEGVMVQGHAEILETNLERAVPKDMGAALEIFKRKFADVVTKGEPIDKVVVSINIKKMVHWRGPKFTTVRT